MRSSIKAAFVKPEHLTVTETWALTELDRTHGRLPHTHTPYSAQQHDASVAEQARAEQERLIHEAYTSGFDEGRLEGEIAEGLRLRNAVLATETALTTIRENEVQWTIGMEANIAALAVAVARQILVRELATEPTIIADLVKRALAEFPIDQALRVRVNPVDLSVLSTHAMPSGEPMVIAPNRDVHWLADARIQPGGCVVEGRDRIVDGRVDTALERVYRRLTDTNA